MFRTGRARHAPCPFCVSRRVTVLAAILPGSESGMYNLCSYATIHG